MATKFGSFIRRVVTPKRDTSSASSTGVGSPILKSSEVSSSTGGFVSSTNPSTPAAYNPSSPASPSKATYTYTGGGGGSTSGGGGGSSTPTPKPSSSGVTPPTSTANQNLGKDTPSSYQSSSVISAYVPPSPKTAVNYFRANLFRQPFGQTVRGTAGIVTERSNVNKQIRFERKAEELNRGTISPSQQDVQSGFRGYSGTATNLQVNKLTDAQLTRNAIAGDKPSLIALSKRTSENIQETTTQIDLKQANIDKAKLTSYTNQLQSQVNSGQITYDQAVSEQERYTNKLDTERAQLVEQKVSPLIESAQTKLDKVAQKGQITSGVAKAVIAGVATGGVAGAIGASSAVGATVVKTAGRAGLVLAGVTTSKYFVENVGTGNLTPLRMASVLVPQVAFVAGASIGGFAGSRAVTGMRGKVDPVKLDTALSNARIEVKSTKAITTESQLKLSKIPQGEQLGKAINSGSSIRVTEFDIKGSTPSENALINKAIPNRKIIFYEITDQMGNVVSRKFVGSIQIRKGIRKFVDLQTGESMGFYDNNLKLLTMETISARISGKGKATSVEIVRSAEITPITPPKYILKNGQIKRAVGSQTATFEGQKVSFKASEGASRQDFNKIMERRTYKKTPSSISANMEFQDLTGIKVNTASLIKTTPELDVKGLGFQETTSKFVTNRGFGVSKNIPKPSVNYDKIINRQMKPFEQAPYDITKDIARINKGQSSGKSSSLPSSTNQKQLLEKLNRQASSEQFSIKDVPQQTFDKNILRSLRQGIKPRTIPKVSNVEAVSFASIFNTQEIKNILGSRTQNKNKLNVLTSPSTTQISRLNELQLTRQPQKFDIFTLQLPRAAFKSDYGFILPTSPRPPKYSTPMLPVFSLGGGGMAERKRYEKLLKKNTISKYSASLGAAEFQRKAINISRKAFEKLSKKTFSGAETRPVFNIVDDVQIKKNKKMLKQVNF